MLMSVWLVLFVVLEMIVLRVNHHYWGLPTWMVFVPYIFLLCLLMVPTLYWVYRTRDIESVSG